MTRHDMIEVILKNSTLHSKPYLEKLSDESVLNLYEYFCEKNLEATKNDYPEKP